MFTIYLTRLPHQEQYSVTGDPPRKIEWPTELTTVTDGGALLLFRWVGPEPFTKKLTQAYGPGQWRHLIEQGHESLGL